MSLGDVTEWMKYFIESRVSLHLIQEPHELLRCQVTAITSKHMHTYEQQQTAYRQQSRRVVQTDSIIAQQSRRVVQTDRIIAQQSRRVVTM